MKMMIRNHIQTGMKKALASMLVLGGVYLLPATSTTISGVYAEESQTKSVKVPAMRNRVYAQLARAQKLADEGDKIEGFNVLSDVKDRIDSLNSYEKAMLWNFYGFMYYGNDDVALAIDSFENVVNEVAIPESLRLSTLYSLAQLTMQQQDYTKTLTYLAQWQSLNSKELTSSQHIMFAQVYYQDKQYEQSLKAVNSAMDIAKTDNTLPKENWLILQRANYYELKQPENVAKVLEQLVKYYEKPQYWIQLSGMYGEIGQEAKQMATMETAWQAGYITKPQQIVTLAQLYRFNGVPYKAAKLLDESIKEGKIVADEKHFAMLAQSYLAAKDNEKAIPALIDASKIAETGKFDAQLAQAYLNLEKWLLAIEYAEKSISRGKIDRIGDMYLVMGMSQFNLQNYDQALMAFKSAQQLPETEKTAVQWRHYVETEKQHHAQLAMLTNVN